MKLLTEEMKKKMLPLYGTEDIEPENREFCAKFFDPCGSWTWYVAEGSESEDGDGDWLFYGLVDGFEKEWGYFRLSELESVTNAFGLGIERDIHFQPCSIEEIS